MKYDFTSVIDRRGKDALAVDAPFAQGIVREGLEPIPMWVADMNFPTCPTIPQTITERAAHPLYGYFRPTDEYYSAIIRWQETRNGAVGLEPRHIGYENGVLGGVLCALGVLCSKGDNVLVHSPTYVGFTKSLTNCGYHIVHSPLTKDEQGVYRMDFADMERKITENRIHAAIFCSPHNPCGRVWEKWEVERFMALCEKHGVWVVSDEIWSDILLSGHQHTPTQSVSPWAREHTAAMYAPSKTFNLAGLVGSYHIVYNDWLRERMEKESSLSHYNAMNVLSMHALIAAYQPEGYEWREELCQVLTENARFACDYIRTHFEGVDVTMPEGTYMLFPDCGGWLERHGKTMDELLHAGWEAGILWQDGREFHGPTHIRMNLASPLSRVKEAFERLDKYVFNA